MTVADEPTTQEQRDFLARYARTKDGDYFIKCPDMDMYGECVKHGESRRIRNGMTIGWPAHGYSNGSCNYCGYPEDAALTQGSGEAQMSEWQPIETAPREGSPFLGAVYWADTGEWEILRMAWNETAGRFGDATYAPFIHDQEQPTHWMPLPEPPKVEKE